ncbi:DUF1579 family protein [Nocardia sp. NPDC004568]|uniref:DUF1579 family protein n=1 Tax=Nocardia sp. NPDC004568 TaxID=3154551 RepID=UPI0033B44452
MLAPVLLTVALLGTACGSADTASEADTSSAAASSVPIPEHEHAGHARLDQLVGEWTVEKSTFVAGGTPENPLRGRDMVSRWRWISKTGNNYLQEEVEGKLGDQPYYRFGLLGYSPLDDRYEWTTVDSVTPMTMSYRGAKGSAASPDISMSGEFTDPGVLGAQNVGKPTPMRTVIRLESSDRVVLELYFTPPNAAEMLADRVVLTRYT